MTVFGGSELKAWGLEVMYFKVIMGESRQGNRLENIY